MTEPISREEFHAANEKTVSSIKGYLDEKFESHEELEAVRYENIDKIVTEHHKTLYGDPSDEATVGLRIKVDRLNTWTKVAYIAIVGILTAGASYLGLK